MRVLVLSPYVPLPVRTGGHSRTLGLIRCLTGFADVHVLAIGDPSDPGLPAAREGLARLGAGLEAHPATGPGPAETDWDDVERLPDAAAHFRSSALAESLSARLSASWPDLVHVEEIVMAQYEVPAPAVLDRQKVEWAYHEALAAGGAADAEWHRREAARFRRWDRALAGRFAATLVAGDGDRRLLAPLHEPLHVVPHGVDDGLRPRPDGRGEVREVLLYGALDYAPNVEAAAFYFREVWPRLREEVPGLRTVVAGSGEAPASVPRDDPRVERRGYVEDLAALLAGPVVLVAPLRTGGGVRTKVLEALAAGRPVVSTAVGTAGLDLEPGREYLAAETAAEMVAAVVRLAREPELALALGRAGAARVDAAFRWSVLAPRVEAIFRDLAPRRRALRGSRRALLVGVGPLPADEDSTALSFPGHRTAQLAAGLLGADCEVRAVLLDEGGGGSPPALDGCADVHLLTPDAYRSGEPVQARLDEFDPEMVVAAGGYHAARLVSRLRTRAPRWVDLPGDLAAEGQLRAARGGDAALRDALAVLSSSLVIGDRFSVVGRSQRLALLGQLGLAGRLTAATLEREPVAVVPLACGGPPTPPALPHGPFEVLWLGGYNTWMDETTLLAGLQEALARCPEMLFVSVGGAVPGHEEGRYRDFWSRARASAAAPRLRDLGRVTRREVVRRLGESHAVVCVARPGLEGELGSRLRLVEALAHGRPVVTTAGGDLAGTIAARGAGVAVPPRSAHALAEALVGLDSDRRRLEAMGRAARALWEAEATVAATTAPLRDWARNPRSWPVSIRPEPFQVDEERLRLQAELDFIRGSVTFRALRLLDRLLGRSPS